MKTLQYLAFAILTISCVRAIPYMDLVPAKSRIDIIRPELYLEYKSDIPKVYGVRTCGGQGKFVAMRLEGCNPENICRFQADNNLRRWETELIPSSDSNGLGIREVALIDGTTKLLYDRAVANSETKAGQRIILNGVGAAGEEMKGINFTSQYFIYRVDDNHVEVCAEVDYEFI